MDATVPTPQTPETPVAKLALRRDQLTKLRRLKLGDNNTDANFAQLIGVNPGQVSRTLQGKSGPGTRFIAGTLELFGLEFFTDLYEIQPDDTTDAA